MVRLVVASLALACDSWQLPEQSDCAEESELVVRYSKALDARGEDAFRLTLLSTTPWGDVSLDAAPLNLTAPRRIEVNEDLCTNWEVRANWSSFWYRSSVLNVSQTSKLSISTGCGSASLKLRNPGRGQGHVSMVFGTLTTGRKSQVRCT